MVSHSESKVNAALCLAVALSAATTSRAQISSTPKRHRSKLDYNKSKGLGRRSSQQGGRRRTRREPEDAASMPLGESDFDMSAPSGLDVRTMSLPLLGAERDMSLPLEELGLDLSMSMSMDGGAAALEETGASDGNTVILASFLASASLLIIGAAALFVRARRTRGRKRKAGEDGDDAPVRVVSMASPGDMETAEQGMSEIVIA